MLGCGMQKLNPYLYSAKSIISKWQKSSSHGINMLLRNMAVNNGSSSQELKIVASGSRNQQWIGRGRAGDTVVHCIPCSTFCIFNYIYMISAIKNKKSLVERIYDKGLGKLL